MQFKPGDRVKVAFEADVTYAHSDTNEALGSVEVWDKRGLAFKVPYIAVAKVAPQEPGHGSIVVDSHGDAWQRKGALWNGTVGNYAHTWQDLVDEYGPIEVLWDTSE